MLDGGVLSRGAGRRYVLGLMAKAPGHVFRLVPGPGGYPQAALAWSRIPAGPMLAAGSRLLGRERRLTGEPGCQSPPGRDGTPIFLIRRSMMQDRPCNRQD